MCGRARRQALPGLVADRLDEWRRVRDVGEQEGSAGADRVRGAKTGERVRREARVPCRPEPLEGRLRRSELELRAVRVAVAAERLSEGHPRLRGLVRRVNLVEEPDGQTQFPQRHAKLPAREGNASLRRRRVCGHRGRAEVPCDLAELVGPGLGRLDVARDQGDLDL